MFGYQPPRSEYPVMSKETYDMYVKEYKESLVLRNAVEIAFPLTPTVNLDTEQEGSAERFEHRLSVFREKKMSIARHNMWWFIHNAIAHPMIGIIPCKKTFAFHDWTSKKINGE